MHSTKEIMTAQEVAEFLKITPLTVYRMAHQGKLPAFKIGSDWRFRRSLIDRWMFSKSSPSPVVLVVDDESSILGLLARVLGHEGYEVLVAENGPTALAQVEDVTPRLALVDLALPGMDGAEVITALRAKMPDLPILIMTGHPDSGVMDRALQVGPFSVLRKPLNTAQLVRYVHQLCWGTPI